MGCKGSVLGRCYGAADRPAAQGPAPTPHARSGGAAGGRATARTRRRLDPKKPNSAAKYVPPHDGNSRAARHVANARRAPNRWGVSIRKETPRSRKKIDAAVCVIGVRMVRALVLASLEWANRTNARQAKRGPGRVWGFG